MLKIRFLILFFIFLSGILFSQEPLSFDKVYKTDKTVVEGKVLRITETQIEFDPKGEIPSILIPRREVSVIIYSDNTVVNLNAEKAAIENTITPIVKTKEPADSIIQTKKPKAIKKPILLAPWKTEFSSVRDLKKKIFKYNYTFDSNVENGKYIITDHVNNQLIRIKETGTFNAEINTNKHSKKRSLFISEIVLDLEFKIGTETIKHRLTSEDLGWSKKSGYIIEAPLNIGKRAPVPSSERIVETKDYSIQYYLELMIPNKVYINYSIATKK